MGTNFLSELVMQGFGFKAIGTSVLFGSWGSVALAIYIFNWFSQSAMLGRVMPMIGDVMSGVSSFMGVSFVAFRVQKIFSGVAVLHDLGMMISDLFNAVYAGYNAIGSVEGAFGTMAKSYCDSKICTFSNRLGYVALTMTYNILSFMCRLSLSVLGLQKGCIVMERFMQILFGLNENGIPVDADGSTSFSCGNLSKNEALSWKDNVEKQSSRINEAMNLVGVNAWKEGARSMFAQIGA